MTEAPERIKAWPWNGKRHSGQWHVAAIGETTEYIRADLVDPAAIREAALREAAAYHQEIINHDQGGLDYSALVGIPIWNAEELRKSVALHERYRDDILALIDKKEGAANDWPE